MGKNIDADYCCRTHFPEQLYLCQASRAEAYDEDFVSRIHSYLVDGSHATCCRFYHGSFFEACLLRQAYDGSSGDIRLRNSEVLRESAGIEVWLLDEIAPAVVPVLAVFAVVA